MHKRGGHEHGDEAPRASGVEPRWADAPCRSSLHHHRRAPHAHRCRASRSTPSVMADRPQLILMPRDVLLQYLADLGQVLDFLTGRGEPDLEVLIDGVLRCLHHRLRWDLPEG